MKILSRGPKYNIPCKPNTKNVEQLAIVIEHILESSHYIDKDEIKPDIAITLK